jgi:PKHD-type hydroxylase
MENNTNLFWIWPNALSNDEIDRIHEKAQKEKTIKGSVFDGNKEARKSNIKWINDLSAHEAIWALGNRVNAEGFGYDLYERINDIQYTEYSYSNKGTYDWHIDMPIGTPISYRMRKLSIIIQLTDSSEYEGGDILFKISGKEETHPESFRQKGTLIAFPSFIMHKVTPVTKGTRNSLVTWFEGPNWR